MSKVIEVTDEDFVREVLKSDLPVFTCFTASWCGSCFPTCLVADGLAAEYSKRIKFVRVDVGKYSELATKYRITALPTIALFQNSQPVKKVIGFHEKGSLRRLLNTILKESEGPGFDGKDKS